MVCENGVCYKRPKQTATAPAETENGSSSSTNGEQGLIDEEKLARIKELLEKKRKEKEEEDARVS